MRKLFRFHRLFWCVLFLTGCLGDTSTGSDSNRKPTIDAIAATPLTVAPGAQATISVLARDDDGDELTYSYSTSSGEIEPQPNGSTAVFTADDQEGVAWITVTVKDPGDSTRTGSVSVNVLNELPVISVGVLALDAASSAEQCLAFFALAAQDIIVDNVIIENPQAQTFQVNISQFVLGGQAVGLQLAGRCYVLQRGTWRFTFSLRDRPEEPGFQFTTTHVQP